MDSEDLSHIEAMGNRLADKIDEKVNDVYSRMNCVVEKSNVIIQKNEVALATINTKFNGLACQQDSEDVDCSPITKHYKEEHKGMFLKICLGITIITGTILGLLQLMGFVRIIK